MTALTIPHFRPLRMGEILDQAIRTYRRNFLNFIGIIALVQVPLQLVQMVVSIYTATSITSSANESNSTFSTATILGWIGLMIISLASLILIRGLGTAAMTRAIVDDLFSQTTGVMEAYRRISNVWGNLLATMFVSALLSIVLFIWMLVPCVGWLTGPGMWTLFSGIVTSLIAPVVVLENVSGMDAIKRAWILANRRFWWLLGFILVLSVFGWLIATGPTLIIQQLISVILPQSADVRTNLILTNVISSIISLLGSLLYMPLYLSAVTLVYFDLRVRTEGFDLALQADSSPELLIDVDHLPLPPTNTNEKLFSSNVMTNAFLLTLLGVGIYLLIVFVGAGLIVLLGGASGL